MRLSASLLLGALLLAGAPVQAGDRAPARGEARLARALEGRIAGEPVDCINQSRVTSSRIIDDTAILYEAGGTLYVNRPDAGAESLDTWDTLVTRLHTSRLCSTDVVHLYESGSQMQTGTVFLGAFVPYTRVKARKAN